jgi:hypothetical protein
MVLNYEAFSVTFFPNCQDGHLRRNSNTFNLKDFADRP